MVEMNKKQRKEKLKELHITLSQLNEGKCGNYISEALELTEQLLSAHGVFVCTFKRTTDKQDGKL